MTNSTSKIPSNNQVVKTETTESYRLPEGVAEHGGGRIQNPFTISPRPTEGTLDNQQE